MQNSPFPDDPGSGQAIRIIHELTPHGGAPVGSPARRFLIDAWICSAEKPLAETLVKETYVNFVENLALRLLQNIRPG